MRLSIKYADLGPGVLFGTARTSQRALLVLNSEVVVNRFRYRAAVRSIAEAAAAARRQQRRAS